MTAGNLIVAYGITDKVTVASSPWLWSNYNMANVVVRTCKVLAKKWQWGTQTAYLKTGDFGDRFYQMEAISIWNTISRRFNRRFTGHFNANYMYFFDETVPFSLRQEPGKNHPYQFSVSSLFEGHFTDHFGMMGELGVLGLDYRTPNPHLGVFFS